ncbi:helix-turn-helix domain-containing protein, partial [Streptococcus uberis]
MSENNFSKAIKESGFSKKEIAEKIGVNPRTLTRWEREESPIPYDKALEIARIINKS